MGMGGLECMIIGAVIVGALLALNYILVTRQERREREPGIMPEPAEIDWDAVSDLQVQEAIQSDKKIEAIKRYRELTGLGLKEAKDAIEYAMAHPEEQAEKKKAPTYDVQDAGVRDLIQEGRIDEAIEVYRKFAGVDEYTAKDAVWKIEQDMKTESSEARLADDAIEPAADPYILSLLAAGNKIEAIKAYREQTGLGLKEAKDAIDQIERGLKKG